MENIKDTVNGIQEDIIKEYKIKVARTWVGSDEKNSIVMVTVHTQDDKYVGTLENAKFYFDEGILPESDFRNNPVVSIGKSFIDGKWYGWSHRAMYGFKIGDVVKEGDCTASSGFTDEYLKEHPKENLALPVGFEAKTEEDAKKMAIAFADSVS